MDRDQREQPGHRGLGRNQQIRRERTRHRNRGDAVQRHDHGGGRPEQYGHELHGGQTITFSGPSNAPSGTAPTYPASVTFANGVATPSPSITLYDAQTTTVTATQGSVSGTSGNVTVTAGANHQIAASAASPQTAGTAFNVTLTAQDTWGNPTGNLTGTKNMTFSGPSKSPNNTAPTYPATATFSAGVATASVTLVDVQTTTITANDTTDAYNGTASNNITVNAGGASSFTVSAPTTATAGTPFTETLTALDAYGNTATSYTGSQTITFTGPATSPGGTAPTYPASVTFANGVATPSPSITLYDAQTTTLTATQGSVSGTSGNVTVSAGANHQIGASAASPQTAGTAFNVTLTAQDTWGNPTGNLTGTKNMTFSGPSKSPNNTAPTYPATATFSAGVATASVTLVDVQTTTITANDTTDAYNGTASNNITVNAGGASSFTVSAPTTATAGTAVHRDAHRARRYGNTAHQLHRQPDDHLHRPRHLPRRDRPHLPRLGHLHQRRRHPLPLDHPLRRPDDHAHRHAGHDHRHLDVVHGRIGHRLADLVHDPAGGRDRRIRVHHRAGRDRQGRLRQHGHRLHQDRHPLDQVRHRYEWRGPHWLHQLAEQRRDHVRRDARST